MASVPIEWSSLISSGMDPSLLNSMITCNIPGLYGDLRVQWRPVLIWTDFLSMPQPPLALQFLPLFSLLIMFRQNPLSNTMSEIVQKLQHADMINDEEDFLVITEEDLEASMEENKTSCYMVDKQVNIQTIRRCLQRASFALTSTSFSSRESVDFVLGHGPWNVEDRLLILMPWTEDFSGEACLFDKTEFWIPISGLPGEWFSGKKLFSYRKDCLVVELRSYWGSKDKFFRIHQSIPVQKPLRRFLRVGTQSSHEI